MNKSMATRKLTSSLWVWNPKTLSREKSFHHKNIIRRTHKKEKKGRDNPILQLKYNTKLERREKTEKERRIGQNEVWTTRNGDLNIFYQRGNVRKIILHRNKL
jgi:hypothetical protein